MLKALELFAGVGGITHGLRGYVEPIAFCEYEKDAAAFLSQFNIPVHGDIRKFDATIYRNKVDIICGGWPCTGFSTAGKGEGFSHEASGLFTEVLRITKECEPDHVFLENSHTLSCIKNIKTVVTEFHKLGFDKCTWFTCKSSDANIGAPHQRHRWFCLVSKSRLVVEKKFVKKFAWDGKVPDKQHPKNTFENKRLLKLMGNSVVPDQVRYAFEKIMEMNEAEGVPIKHTEKHVRCGYSLNNEIFSVPHVYESVEPSNIVLTPKEIPEKHCVPDKNNILLTPVICKFWNTPCLSHSISAKGAKVLTKRCSKFLPCQVIFCRDGNIKFYLSGKFSAYLMGYDKDYLGYLLEY